jgi:hypothetical protein
LDRQGKALAWGGIIIGALAFLSQFFGITASNVSNGLGLIAFPISPLLEEEIRAVVMIAGIFLIFLGRGKLGDNWSLTRLGRSSGKSPLEFWVDTAAIFGVGVLFTYSEFSFFEYTYFVPSGFPIYQFLVTMGSLLMAGAICLVYSVLAAVGELIRIRSMTSESSLRPASYPLLLFPKLTLASDLEAGLTKVIKNQKSDFPSFRHRAVEYNIQLANAEALFGSDIDHKAFYVNPDTLRETSANSSLITEKSSELLRMAKAYRAKALGANRRS